MPKTTPKKQKAKKARSIEEQLSGHDTLLMKLLRRNEKLHPDLAAVLDNEDEEFRMIRHPLLQELYLRPALHNYQYKMAKEQCAEAQKKGDWPALIQFHAGPYRLRAFKQYADRLSDAEYWETLAEVWACIENIWQYRDDISKLLTSKRPQRERMMDEKERKKLASLPDELTIYRGFIPGKNRNGWSWTLSKATAKWFAKRFASLFGKGEVATGTCAKSDVIALLLGRKEAEIIIDPKKVKVA